MSIANEDVKFNCELMFKLMLSFNDIIKKFKFNLLNTLYNNWSLNLKYISHLNGKKSGEKERNKNLNAVPKSIKSLLKICPF